MRKNKLLPIFVCMLIVLSTMFFSACSNINLTTVVNDDGTIDEFVTIKIDEQDLISQGYSSDNILQIKNDIVDCGTQASSNICSDFNVRVQADILLATTPAEVVKLNSYLNGISSLQNNLTEDGSYVFGIRFKNADVYRYYYNMSANHSPTYKTEKHFLYTKYYYYGLTMYADYTSLYSNIKSSFATKYPTLILNNKATLTYTYQTEYRREHTDADLVTEKNGVYYHTWLVDEDNFQQPIMIYYNIANSGNCILLCVGATMVICLLLWLVAFIVDKSKAKKAKQSN